MANLNDIIALAKAGYKVKEITKMIEEDKNKDKIEDTSASIDDKASLSTINETSTPDDEDDTDVEVELVEKEDTTDYKALYEEQKKQTEEAQKKLKIAQQVNVRQPVQNEKEQTEEEFYEDLANAFL